MFGLQIGCCVCFCDFSQVDLTSKILLLENCNWAPVFCSFWGWKKGKVQILSKISCHNSRLTVLPLLTLVQNTTGHKDTIQSYLWFYRYCDCQLQLSDTEEKLFAVLNLTLNDLKLRNKTRKRILMHIFSHSGIMQAILGQHALYLTPPPPFSLSLTLRLHACRGYLPGLAWGRSTCRTGAGRTRHPLPTPACDGCLESPATRASAPTWSGRRWLALKPTPARPPPTAWSVKNLPVRKTECTTKGGREGRMWLKKWKRSDWSLFLLLPNHVFSLCYLITVRRFAYFKYTAVKMDKLNCEREEQVEAVTKCIFYCRNIRYITAFIWGINSQRHCWQLNK